MISATQIRSCTVTSLSVPFAAYAEPRHQNLGFNGFIAVACAHLLVVLLLWSMAGAPRVPEPVALLWVSLAVPAPAKAQPSPPAPRVSAAEAQRPLAAAAAPAGPTASLQMPATDKAPVAEAAAASEQAVAPSRVAPEVTSAPVPATPPEAEPAVAPQPRRQLPASAVQYRVLPPVELPRASRRAGESGTVWLRVLVDAAGLPAQVTVQRSSGFARLDEQALWAMRQARFRPHTEDGRAIEVEVTAPVEYPQE